MSFFNKKEITYKDENKTILENLKEIILKRHAPYDAMLGRQHIHVQVHNSHVVIEKRKEDKESLDYNIESSIDIEISEAILLRDFLIYALDGVE